MLNSVCVFQSLMATCTKSISRYALHEGCNHQIAYILHNLIERYHVQTTYNTYDLSAVPWERVTMFSTTSRIIICSAMFINRSDITTIFKCRGQWFLFVILVLGVKSVYM